MKNLEAYKKDLSRLVVDGIGMVLDLYDEAPDDKKSETKNLPEVSKIPFSSNYQKWYSEARSGITGRKKCFI